MRKLIFSLVILLAFLLAVEIGITLLSEHGLERVVRSQYGLPDTLEVSINSFPFTLSLLRNHLGEVRLSWENDLLFIAPGGAETSAPYYGQVAAYDVELNMPSLLRGRLDIKKISHIQTAIVLDEYSINKAFGLDNGGFKIEDGEIFMMYGNLKVKYQVKVADGKTISVEPILDSTSGTGSQENTQPIINPAPLQIALYGLPFDATLEKISSEGDRMVLEISIPDWEGYL